MLNETRAIHFAMLLHICISNVVNWILGFHFNWKACCLFLSLRGSVRNLTNVTFNSIMRKSKSAIFQSFLFLRQSQKIPRLNAYCIFGAGKSRQKTMWFTWLTQNHLLSYLSIPDKSSAFHVANGNSTSNSVPELSYYLVFIFPANFLVFGFLVTIF